MSSKKQTSKTSSKSALANFEDSLSQLEQLVKEMEDGNLSLDESLKHYEKGVQLTAICQKALSEAEQKVEILQKNTLENFSKTSSLTTEEE